MTEIRSGVDPAEEPEPEAIGRLDGVDEQLVTQLISTASTPPGCGEP